MTANLPKIDFLEYLAQHEPGVLAAADAAMAAQETARAASNGVTPRASNGTAAQSVLDRARKFLFANPPAVDVDRGGRRTFGILWSLLEGYDLRPDDIRDMVYEWNELCSPPWDTGDLEHKIAEADKKAAGSARRGYLLKAPGPNGQTNGRANGQANGHVNGQAGAHANGQANGQTNGQANGQVPAAQPKETPPLSDIGNAQRLVAAHGSSFRWVKAYGDHLHYDGVRWSIDERSLVEAYAKQIHKVIEQEAKELPPEASADQHKMMAQWRQRSQMVDRIRAAISLAKSEEGMSVTPVDLNTNPMLFNVLNGTIDLETGILYPHDPANLITKIAPVVYDPSATCPRFDQFLVEVFPGHPELAEYVLRALAYCLTGLIREHHLFFCWGTGRNGKTTLLGAAQGLLGDYAVEIMSDVLLYTLGPQHPTGLTELEGRRLVIAEEADDGKRFGEATVKRLTGGNSIQARKMHQDFYTFRPTAKFWLAANHRPDIRGTDPAIWSRVKLIEFNACFDPKVPGSLPPDLDLPSIFVQERSGILNRLLQRLASYLRDGLCEPPSVTVATDSYRASMDRFADFLETCCVVGEDSRGRPLRESLPNLYQEYALWAKASGYEPLGKLKFSEVLEGRKFKTLRSNSVTWKLGLRLKSYEEKAGETKQDELDEQEDSWTPF